MKIKMSIRSNMLITILTTSVLIFVLSVGYMSYKTRQIVLDNAKMLALSVTKENALKIEKALSEDLIMLNTLSDVFSFTQNLDEQVWKEFYADICKKIFPQKDNLVGFSASWEESFYNSKPESKQTRYFYHLGWDNKILIEDKELRDLSSSLYQRSKKLNKSVLLQPRNTTHNGKKVQEVNLLSPIRLNKSFAGYVVGDFSTESFQEIVSSITPYKSTVGFLISNTGIFVSHPEKDHIGDTLAIYESHLETQFQLSEYIKEGKAEVFKGINKEGENILLVTAPIVVGEHEAPWALTLMIPIKSILYEANKTQTMSLIVAIIGILLIAVIIFWRASNIGNAIKKITAVLEKLSQGDIENIDNLVLNRGDEIDLMSNSVNALKASLNETSAFAEQIGEGHLDAKFKPLGEQDKLGNSLLNMQQNLKKAKADEEKMKLEEEKNTWASNGLAKFGEIIRSNNEDIEQLSYSIVKNLVDYLELSIGSLFVAETTDDETVYVVKAAIAYERRKIINAKFTFGEALVGRCAFEKRSIYMTDLPQDYISIRSGLGDTNPGCLLLVPLISEEKVFGVIELASLKPIEDHKVEFVEKLGESIASTLASAQINQRTVQLLEQSKMQREELAAQEEEMRQNMEELQATQEEATRREQEMLGTMDIVDRLVFRVEYDISGRIICVNDKYAGFLNLDTVSLNDKTISHELELLGGTSINSNDLWAKLLLGNVQVLKTNALIDGVNYTIEEHYAPLVLQNQNNVSKIIKVSYIAG